VSILAIITQLTHNINGKTGKNVLIE